MLKNLSNKEKTMLAAAASFFGSLFLIAVFILLWSISVINDESRLRTRLVNQEMSVKADVDQVFAILKNQAALQKSDQEKFERFYPTLMQAKYGEMKDLTVGFLKDANPNWNDNLSDKLFKSMESQFMYRTHQFKEYVNLKNLHDITMDNFPGSVVFKIMGKGKVQIVIPVSAETNRAFQTGEIDNTIVK